MAATARTISVWSAPLSRQPRAGAHRGEHRGVVVVHRQHQNADLRAGGDDATGGLDPVELGHVEVHHDDVGLGGMGRGHRADTGVLLRVGVDGEDLTATVAQPPVHDVGSVVLRGPGDSGHRDPLVGQELGRGLFDVPHGFLHAMAQTGPRNS
jgi:hypothetical protein